MAETTVSAGQSSTSTSSPHHQMKNFADVNGDKTNRHYLSSKNPSISASSTPQTISQTTPTPASTAITPSKRNSRSTSCYLCQRRKQKCDQRLPHCTNCIKAKVPCQQPPRYGENNVSTKNQNNEYTLFLEKKVKQLEKLLDLKAQERQALLAEQARKPTLNDEKILKYKKISNLIVPELPPLHQHMQTPLPPLQLPSLSHNSNSNSNSTSTSTSTSSSILITKSPFHHVNIPYLTFMNENKTLFENSTIRKYPLVEIMKLDPEINIDHTYAKNLISLYFKMLQFKFPLLDEVELQKLNDSVYEEGKVSDNDDSTYYNCALLNLVFAISALFYKSTGKYKGPNPFCFFSAALRYCILLDIKSFTDSEFRKIDLLVLMCTFLIRADKNSNNLYLLIQEISHTCMRLKLHKSKTYANLSVADKDLRMRKFWCCYMLERSILISISKPFVMGESKIDMDIPLFNSQSTQHDSFINQSIKIKRLESKFIERLKINSSTNSTSTSSNIIKAQLVKVEKFFQELQNWRNECRGFNNNGIENQTLLFYYYKAVRNLIQPYLELLDPADKLFKECQAAAGQICQSLKNYHSKTFHGFSILNIHLVFVAGITLVYCWWLQRNRDDMQRKLLGDDKKHTRPVVSEDLFTGLNDMSACSICLYVMSERTKFALSFRDIFDEIMTATVGNLILRCGPDSSEILYRGSGLPPAIYRKPFKHFQIDSNLDRSDDDQLEDEERLKRKGHLTRSAIPKGLSHLLLHPPGQETDSVKDDSDDSKGKSKTSSSFSSDRILPPPVRLPMLSQQQNYRENSESDIANKGSPFTSSVLSPLNHTTVPNTTKTISNANTTPNSSLANILSTPAGVDLSVKKDNLQQPMNETMFKSPVSEYSQTSSKTSSSNFSPKVNDSFIVPNSIPQLFPFVGGTTTMISNISTWTEESGQQVPQTGLPHASGTGYIPMNGSIYSGPIAHTPGGLPPYDSIYMQHQMQHQRYQQQLQQQEYEQQLQVKAEEALVNAHAHAHAHAHAQVQTQAQIDMPPSNYQQPFDQQQQFQHNVQMGDNLGGLFDVVGNEDSWYLNNDIGFFP
ncbi:hypothetical protein CANINC_002650 [Pichia inconspicua]|uniref:Zn(2)-C6 fungal-type domain-containing protein n=1 Tax=Pichia inconspicua TaxID=52247 RepID=A0A4T0X0Q1_9ASCO|nr:hypothetical protein CANINC_002650 [[Candida] inconspicua]